MENAVSVSIITINYNNSNGLEKTIHSVLNQTYSNYEYIIIDGGSTDGSVDIIKKYQNHLSYWISEKDNGIYHAMNKGIKQAKGDYLLMLNSGDFLINPYIIQNASTELRQYTPIVYGDVIWSVGSSTFYGAFPKNLNFSYFIENSLGHQAAFIHKKVHEIVGLYDEELKIVSDWQLFILAICKYSLGYKHLSFAVSECSRDGLSCKPENLPLIIQERKYILNKYFSLFISDYERMLVLENELAKIEKTFMNKVKRKIISFIRERLL